MNDYPRTQRSRLRRLPKRGSYDRERIHAIIDAALICHVGFIHEGEPAVVPTAIMRVEDAVYVHGSRVSRMMKTLASGAPACISVTHLDGLVLARSGFHHSMNYRAVIVYARGEPVRGDAKHALLDRFVEALVPGRLQDIRPPTRKELNATAVVRFPLSEVSAKRRSGPPLDDDEDYALPIWAGELPLAVVPGKPIPDPRLRSDVPVPAYIRRYPRRDA